MIYKLSIQEDVTKSQNIYFKKKRSNFISSYSSYSNVHISDKIFSSDEINFSIVVDGRKKNNHSLKLFHTYLVNTGKLFCIVDYFMFTILEQDKFVIHLVGHSSHVRNCNPTEFLKVSGFEIVDEIFNDIDNILGKLRYELYGSI